ncbi:MAG: heme ABC exporter ATP-binding protein CcmA [Cyclobacteriaceae bacterium]|nr:MAG: heme ABC exporter ATP-binding protein CcmA [Cyclobacteriaceae bacterium]
MDIRLSVSNLGKRFQTEWIFRRLSYTFQAGTTYAITGPNGSGKSTLLKVLSGQLPPSEGTISYLINNHPVDADEVFRYIGFAAPYMDLMDEFTLMEQLRFHFSLKPLVPGFTPEQVMDEMYLSDAAFKQLGNFSSGMKQRLKLGLCLFTNSPVVLLDEPSSNLDSRAMVWYREQLAKLKNGRLIIIAGNNPQEFPPEARVISLPDWKPGKQPVT